jgi:hypothetical protein
VPDCWESAVGGPIAEATVRLIVLLGLRTCWFEPFPFDAQLPRIEPGRIVLPADEPGVASWSLGPGVELPVRHDGLTVGRFVLVSVSPTAGVGFSPSERDEAISTVVPVGALIAAALIADREPVTISTDPGAGALARRSVDAEPRGARAHRRRPPRRGREDLER